MRRSKKAKKAGGVGTVFIKQNIRIDHVFFRFGHFLDPAEGYRFRALFAHAFIRNGINLIGQQKTVLRT